MFVLQLLIVLRAPLASYREMKVLEVLPAAPCTQAILDPPLQQPPLLITLKTSPVYIHSIEAHMLTIPGPASAS